MAVRPLKSSFSCCSLPSIVVVGHPWQVNSLTSLELVRRSFVQYPIYISSHLLRPSTKLPRYPISCPIVDNGTTRHQNRIERQTTLGGADRLRQIYRLRYGVHFRTRPCQSGYLSFIRVDVMKVFQNRDKHKMSNPFAEYLQSNRNRIASWSSSAC